MTGNIYESPVSAKIRFLIRFRLHLVGIIFLLSGLIIRPIRVQAMEVSSSTIALRWTAPGDDGHVGRATTYDIRYSTEPITADNWAGATQCINEPRPSRAGRIDSVKITGLLSGTRYYVAMKVADEVPNWSQMSNVVTATTHGSSDVHAVFRVIPAKGDHTVPVALGGDDGAVSPPSIGDRRENVNDETQGDNHDSRPAVVDPIDGLQASRISGLAPLRVTFHDESNGPVTRRHWAFGNGKHSVAANPSHLYTKPGIYSVKLIVANDSIADTAVAENLIRVTGPATDRQPPSEITLSRNYPNPFNLETNVQLTLENRSRVRVDVYNLLGQRVATLVDRVLEARSHDIAWRANNHASGVYFFRAVIEETVLTRKVILAK